MCRVAALLPGGALCPGNRLNAVRTVAHFWKLWVPLFRRKTAETAGTQGENLGENSHRN